MATDLVDEATKHLTSVSQLPLFLGADLAAAATAAVSISPVVCLIDSTIMLRAATSCSFGACLRKFLTPLHKLPHNLLLSLPARLVLMVYFGTYATANIIDTVTNFARAQPPATVTSGSAKFFGTATMSTALTVYKDSRMVRCLGQKSLAASTPLMTYCLFTVRDAITIFASFNLPTMIAPRLRDLPDSVKLKLGRFAQTESGRFKTAQFLLPAAVQFVTTPIHLLGLDVYNRRGRDIGFPARCGHIVRDLSIAIPARMARIVPAFGVGGITNASTRSTLMQMIT